MTVFDVTLSDSFAQRLKPHSNTSNNRRPAPRPGAAPLTLRFSVPPDTLETHAHALELNRTPRGEYTLHQAEHAAANAPGPTFKGPATAASDVECVLVWNSRAQRYEVHPLGAELQMAPQLKARTKPSGSGSSTQPTVLREAPASAKPALSRQSSARPGSSAGTPIASPSLGPVSGSGPAHSSAMLPPRRATSARLPTRRSAKKVARPARSPPTSHGSSSSASDGAAPRAARTSSSEPRSPPKPNIYSGRPRAASHTAASPPTSTPRLAPAEPSPSPPSGSVSPARPGPRKPAWSATLSPNPAAASASASGLASSSAAPSRVPSLVASPNIQLDSQLDDSQFDDDFGDLADELEDELEASLHSAPPAGPVGTAMNSANDDEDTSEEE